ncbi:hypothetical protein GGX14DRAFT_387204 [Mycena pura]|uniref:Uncharacterized protein n=1 Tax=Mycena pura TaxID=153505 RepID=A0AAD7E2A8_9AGAR|nr:hypothetical protein GGX14DRAFT_387204 [Mycena pura]
MSLSYGSPPPSINASSFRCPLQSCGYKLKLQYSRNRREYYLKHWNNSHTVFWHHLGPGDARAAWRAQRRTPLTPRRSALVFAHEYRHVGVLWFLARRSGRSARRQSEVNEARLAWIGPIGL